jgi:hypothetical protein
VLSYFGDVRKLAAIPAGSRAATTMLPPPKDA